MSAPPAVRRVALTGELTIQTASQEKAGLLALLEVTADEGADLELDLSGITELDTAGLQLLLMARREAVAAGRSLSLAAPSHTVLEVLRIAHLDQRLGPEGSVPGEEAR